MSEEKDLAMEFAVTVGEAIQEAAESGVDPEIVATTLGYHIGNILRYCNEPLVMVRVLEAIQEMNNEHGDATKIVVESASSDEEVQEKINALKEKPEGDLH